ncbi:GNAT family N-acetyltransferase [Roseibium sp. RKSG952]|uniref:GNAT family N-acetyltransferase n=1 Tax=Roseibium sp. RKSG952 TaxID=2529384 RepID=UPI0012BD6384|nr:GNAT family N-acetyltransferase [Roseibium sp. RKSG952]MTH96728.1 N-acetyltransferase [Roseibium sp. RKSG952]
MHGLVMESGFLRFERFAPDDVGLIRNLWSDPRVARFISSDDNNWSAREADRFVMSALEDQERHGFSRWKVVAIDGTFLGWAGFAVLEETSEIELDYCFAMDALEADPEMPERVCRDLIEWFFDNTYFSHLVSVVRTDNRLVRTVMLDCGFYYRESRQINGMPCDIFQILSPFMQSYVLTA